MRFAPSRADAPALEASSRLDPEFDADEPRLQVAFEIDRCVRVGGNHVVRERDDISAMR